MDIQKKSMLIGIWICLALALLLTQASGAGALRSPTNEGSVAAVTPPPLPVWGGDIDHAYQVQPGLANPLPGSAAAGMGLTLPGVNPPGAVSPGENGVPLQINSVCPVDSLFHGTKDGWQDIVGGWFAVSAYMYTNGIADSNVSIAAPGNYGDFSYEVRMLRLGSEGSANRLIVRGTPLPLDSRNQWYSQYIFQYTNSGSFSIFKKVDGVLSMIQDWTKSSAISQGAAWNTLRVVAEGTSLSYYINGVKVWSGTDTSLSTGRFGVGMYRAASTSGEELRVDFARVCEVEYLTYLPRVTQP